MDLKQLQNIVVVLEKGSVTRAAEALHISQPALTKSIHRLEQQLGVPLFVRDAKGMRPTIYAEALRPHAHGLSAGLEQALRELESLKSEALGTVRVAAGPLMTSEILARAALTLLRAQSDLRIKIHTAAGDHTPGLIRGEYDFVLSLLPVEERSSLLFYRELLKDDIAVIAGLEHPLASRTRVQLKALLPCKWVMPPVTHNHRLRLKNAMETEGLAPPEPVIECSSTEFIKTVVSRSDCLGLVARMGLQDPRKSRVKVLPIDSPHMTRSLGLIWRRNQVLSRASRVLISTIEAVCHDHQR